jgi:tetratricopeptide (TPR) repeat protein
LACNALGYILRKQGEGWKSGEISPQQAVQCFQQSIGYLEQAAKIFPEEVSESEKVSKPGQVMEPIRSWEAYNERGSLYREWGYLLSEQKSSETEQELYTKAIEFQLKALKVARRGDMRFQEADTCDDLARVWHDRGDRRKAYHWLKQAISLVPKEYILIDKEYKNEPQRGEAYWLILGKAYWQEGQWALETVSKDSLSERKHQKYIQNVVKNFTLAAYYFECYWPETSVYNERLRSMADKISKLGLPIREVKSAIKDVAERHKVNVSRFLRMLNDSLPRRIK